MQRVNGYLQILQDESPLIEQQPFPDGILNLILTYVDAEYSFLAAKLPQDKIDELVGQDDLLCVLYYDFGYQIWNRTITFHRRVINQSPTPAVAASWRGVDCRIPRPQGLSTSTPNYIRQVTDTLDVSLEDILKHFTVAELWQRCPGLSDAIGASSRDGTLVALRLVECPVNNQRPPSQPSNYPGVGFDGVWLAGDQTVRLRHGHVCVGNEQVHLSALDHCMFEFLVKDFVIRRGILGLGESSIGDESS